VEALEVSAGVFLRGYKVGLVNEIEFAEGSLNDIVVSFSVESRISIPEGSKIELYSAGLLGTKALNLVPSPAGTYHEFGDTLHTAIKEDMLSSLESNIDPVIENLNSVTSGIDSLVFALNDLLDKDTRANLQNSIENLTLTSDKLRVEMEEGGSIHESLNSLSAFSETLTENREKLSSVFSNVENLTDSLAQSNVKEVISSLNTTVEQTGKLLEGINKGEGSLGLLATNDSLYVNLSSAIQSLDLLLKDLNDNPNRYVHFSVFGRKDKED
jgi:phospholipid/cholesterol/gamma-HCH transport system substrate-binding protein